MADDKPTLHIDTDWKKQAQEEKKRLAEQAAAKPKESLVAGPPASVAPTAPGRAPRERGEMPPPSFASLVQGIMTQVLFYLGDLAQRGGEPAVNLDMARHQLDTLSVLEQKTANNLTPEEQKLIDTALYETRMRFVSVASQFIN
jgi:hypothetical protein